MDQAYFSFENLELWKKGRQFKLTIRAIVKQFPIEEKYKLNDQLIRSTRSFNALIAEGNGRYTFPDQVHFCIQARGSLYETINHLIDAHDENYIDANQLSTLKNLAKELERLLHGYIAYLRKMKTKSNEKNNKNQS
ncbi:MAG: four helix bundle protein [Ferruginibacter sp.]